MIILFSLRAKFSSLLLRSGSSGSRRNKSDCRSSCRTWTRLNENSIWKWFTVMKSYSNWKIAASFSLRRTPALSFPTHRAECHWGALKEIEKLGHQLSQVSNIKRLMSSLSQVSCFLAWTSLKLDAHDGFRTPRKLTIPAFDVLLRTSGWFYATGSVLQLITATLFTVIELFCSSRR